MRLQIAGVGLPDLDPPQVADDEDDADDEAEDSDVDPW
jgi:hypothetical protein